MVRSSFWRIHTNMNHFFVKQLPGEGRYVHDGTTKHRRIEMKLTFVILSEYGILYGTLLVTYVGQYST